ncbi:MAG: winged helix DNA-binding protein [Mesorhizobium sp.]|nr:winged helix DNA-binding protein [Mesorhizobium sp.]
MRWRAEVDRAVERFGLTHAQYSILASLHTMTAGDRRPTQRELSDYAGLQTIYVSKLVRALETAGFLTRDPDADDSRAVRLALTDFGRQTIAAARAVVRDLDSRLTAPIGGPDGEATKALARTLGVLLDRQSRKGEPT